MGFHAAATVRSLSPTSATCDGLNAESHQTRLTRAIPRGAGRRPPGDRLRSHLSGIVGTGNNINAGDTFLHHCPAYDNNTTPG